MMESPPTVCYSMGTINSLVEKITPLLENHPMMEDLLQDVKSLREDLMNKFAAGGRASGGERVKVWMKQVREMVYDMEDWIDLKLQEEGANLSQSDKPRMDGFRSLIQDARGRCERYELLERAAAATANSDAGAGRPGEVAGGRLLWEEKTVLLGIDAPKSELLNHLSSEQKELKVVSILGAGGHGKTALAREIYRDICTTKQFECQAFVSVGRTTSTRTALIELLRQVKSDTNAPQSRSYNDEKQVSEIITELFRFLKTKRYFICIDDIRSTQDSESITCALPDNNLGSRILTTSRMKDIAKLCSRRPSDVVYEMMSLGEDNTRSLFLNNVYVQEEEWPDHFKESSKKLFKVCGDVPFAIIITAGLLGRTSAELSARSDRLTKTILSELDQFDSAPQVMGKILDISYGDLPLPLKSCFLYMAAFIGNHGIIKRGRLIQRWVAEGLIPERHGKSSLETGASYFDELISRRLIQPAFDDNDDQPIGCTVHGVVADFVASLSTEENFITMGAELKSGGLFPCDRVRRVSLDYSGEDEADTSFSTTYCLLEQKSWVCSDEKPSSDIDEAISLHLSRVRSLAFLGDATRIPDVSALKHMRVLDLEDTKGLENKHLGSIGQLSLLRYLGLCGTNVTVLPPEVMALKQLTTLNLRQTRVKRLPKFGDTKLVSLLAHQLTILPRGMGVMAELEELSEVLVGQDGSHAGDVARLIAELGQLRMLGVRFGRLFNNQETDRRGVKHLLEEMAKSNLQSLLLDNYLHHLLDLLIASWAKKRPQYLRKFELRIPGCLPLVPPDIGSLIALTHLHIHVEAVEPQPVHALGCLPNLVVLRLELSTDPTLTVCGTDGFQCLKVFWYGGGGNGIGLRFEVGAMPQLRRLRLDLDAREAMLNYGHLQFGIQHLPCLVHVHAIIQCKDASAGTEVDGMEAFIRDQVSLNPNDPVLEINTRVQRSVAKAAEGAVIAIHNREGWMNQIDPDKLMVVDFSTSWCPASRRMAPVFADLAKMYPNVVFLTVDVDDNDEMSTVAKQFGVNGVPTFLFMKGGYVQDRVVGAEKEELEEKLQEHAALML